jgi:hypothetical protein
MDDEEGVKIYEFEIVPLTVKAKANVFKETYVYTGSAVEMSFYVQDADFNTPLSTVFQKWNGTKYLPFAGIRSDTGKYRVVLSIPQSLESGKYYRLSEDGDEAFDFEILKHKADLSAQDYTVVYNAAAQQIAYALGGIFRADYDKVPVVTEYYDRNREPLGRNGVINPGVYIVSLWVEHDNYDSDTVDCFITVTPAELGTIVTSENTYAYDGAAKKPAVAFRGNPLFLKDADIAVSYEYTKNGVVTDRAVDAGLYTVKITASAFGFQSKTVVTSLDIQTIEFEVAYRREKDIILVEVVLAEHIVNVNDFGAIESEWMYRVNQSGKKGAWQESNIFYNLSENEDYEIEVMSKNIRNGNYALNYHNESAAAISYGIQSMVQSAYNLPLILGLVGGLIALIAVLAIVLLRRRRVIVG